MIVSRDSVVCLAMTAAVAGTGCADVAQLLDLPGHTPSSSESPMAGDRELVSLCRADRAGAMDDDGDGLPDDCEQEIAERFAPVVYHSTDESNYPTNVDHFLARTALAYFDEACGGSSGPIAVRPNQRELLGRRQRSCAGGDLVVSNGTRSRRKRRTFFLRDVDDASRAGSRETTRWTTYFHAYRSDAGGITVQYWRFYAYNDALNNHGGDWEGLHVVLDAEMRPTTVRLLGHSQLQERPYSSFDREGTHVRVFSEGGGHGTRASGDGIEARGCGSVECAVDPNDPRTFVRQETWSGGEVRFPGAAPTRTGALVNVGAKTHPMNGQHFIAYSGLWGSPGLLFGTSGYWGPAFNETAMSGDGYITAWCAGMTGDVVKSECYATKMTP